MTHSLYDATIGSLLALVPVLPPQYQWQFLSAADLFTRKMEAVFSSERSVVNLSIKLHCFPCLRNKDQWRCYTPNKMRYRLCCRPFDALYRAVPVNASRRARWTYGTATRAITAGSHTVSRSALPCASFSTYEI